MGAGHAYAHGAVRVRVRAARVYARGPCVCKRSVCMRAACVHMCVYMRGLLACVHARRLCVCARAGRVYVHGLCVWA